MARTLKRRRCSDPCCNIGQNEVMRAIFFGRDILEKGLTFEGPLFTAETGRHINLLTQICLKSVEQAYKVGKCITEVLFILKINHIRRCVERSICPGSTYLGIVADGMEQPGLYGMHT